MPSAHLLAVGVRLCGGRRKIVGRSPEVIIMVGKRTRGGRQKMCDSKFSRADALNLLLVNIYGVSQ